MAPLASALSMSSSVEVPRVDHDATRVRVVDQHFDRLVIGLGLGERVVQRDVDVVDDWLVRVDLGDDDPILVLVEHVGEPGQHDLVVVDEREHDGAAWRWTPLERKHP